MSCRVAASQDHMRRKRVLVTGSTGTMGMYTLKEFASRSGSFDVVMFARPGRRNRRKLKPFLDEDGFSVVWGDLCDYDDVAKAVEGVDYVLHFGGLVSPQADYNPALTMMVNVGAARNIARAVAARPDADRVKVVAIGSVAQMGDRRPPCHWGRTGDQQWPSVCDPYALSKIESEREIVDSGIKNWVSLRQTGILCHEILMKGTDPITFHVPLAGVLEWTTAEDSARLMVNICEDRMDHPSFWNHFHNIGGGESYRMTNYEFEQRLMKALGCPPPEKVFEPDWFALKNFHGQWWADSDRLEELVPYRSGKTCDEYFRELARSAPWYFRLMPLVPARIMKRFMRSVAMKPHGTLRAIADGDDATVKTLFGSYDERDAIPGWDVLRPALMEAVHEKPGSRFPAGKVSEHGYDESKPESELDIADMCMKAAFHGGKCLSETMKKGDMAALLEWECRDGHVFRASPALVLLGGHWCPECLRRHCCASDWM